MTRLHKTIACSLLTVIPQFALAYNLTPTSSTDHVDAPQTEIAQANLARKVQTIIEATPQMRVAPKYPTNEARSGRDGWVELSFIVEPDGSTSNIIVKNSSGSKAFEKEAVKATKRWKYSPAIENGKAIQQCNNSVQLDFKMSRKAGVTKKFNRLYNKFTEAITSNDTEKVAELFPKMRDYELYTHLESYYQYTTLAIYEEKYGSKQQQYKYLSRAIRFSGAYDYFKKLKQQDAIASASVKVKSGEDSQETIKQNNLAFNQQLETSLAPVLHQKLVLELELNKLSQALRTLEQLMLLSVNSENHNAYANQQGVIDRFILSDEPFKIAGAIANNDFWHHKLLRNEFAFAQINGGIHKIDLRCSNKRHVYTVTDQSKWKIPSAWKDCSIYVYGDDDATFMLIETTPTANLANQAQALSEE